MSTILAHKGPRKLRCGLDQILESQIAREEGEVEFEEFDDLFLYIGDSNLCCVCAVNDTPNAFQVTLSDSEQVFETIGLELRAAILVRKHVHTPVSANFHFPKSLTIEELDLGRYRWLGRSLGLVGIRRLRRATIRNVCSCD